MFPGKRWRECPNSGSMGRDKLVHEYFGVKLDVLWKTIKNRLPELKALIKEVLEKMNKEIGEDQN